MNVKSYIVITVRDEVAKVMYLHVCVCPQGGGDVPGPGRVYSGGGAWCRGSASGGVPGPGGGWIGIPACTEADPLPRERRLLLPTAHILLDCILVTKSVPSVAELQENVPFTHIAPLPIRH